MSMECMALCCVLKGVRSSSGPHSLSYRAALQLAVDSPRNSLITKAAALLPAQPPALLMTKEDNWSPILSTFLGHAGPVTRVVYGAVGGIVVSASEDGTLR